MVMDSEEQTHLRLKEGLTSLFLMQNGRQLVERAEFKGYGAFSAYQRRLRIPCAAIFRKNTL